MKALNGLEVVVTGGAGFIGSHLCRTLVENDAKVTLFDNLSSGKIDSLKDLENKGAKNVIFSVNTLYGTASSQEVVELECDLEGMHVLQRSYIHECDNDDSCLVGFNLISRSDKWEENIAAYESMIESIKIGILE